MPTHCIGSTPIRTKKNQVESALPSKQCKIAHLLYSSNLAPSDYFRLSNLRKAEGDSSTVKSSHKKHLFEYLNTPYFFRRAQKIGITLDEVNGSQKSYLGK